MAEVHSIKSSEEFEALASSHQYVIVDFTAEWCPPCKAIAPMYAQLAKKYGAASALAFAKVDVDELSDISQRYGITAMPSFLLLKDGEPGAVELPGITGGGAVISEGKLGLIKGADPRALTALAERLSALVKETPSASA